MKFLYHFLNGLLWMSMIALLATGAAHADGNLVIKPSNYSVADTIDRIEKAVTAKGMKIFARIDHSGEARNVGLEMKPTQLLIFGNPKGGTTLMMARPTVAIDLPMKALAWEDKDGKVWLTYNAPELLQERHGLPGELAARLEPVGKLDRRAHV